MTPTGVLGVVWADGVHFRLLTAGLSLAGALLTAAVVIALVSRWRRRSGVEGVTPDEQLTHFRSLYERGEISEEEFRRLRALLIGQVAAPLGVGRPPERPATPGEIGIKPPDGELPAGPPPDGIRPA
jgi:hypothetical protein